MDEYKETGTKHNEAGIALGGILEGAAKQFKGDQMLEEPLSKVLEISHLIVFFNLVRYKHGIYLQCCC